MDTSPRGPIDDDELIDRIRERIADPERRLDERPSVFSASLAGSSPGRLLELGRAVATDLRHVSAFGADAAAIERAAELEREMSTPAARPLPAPASPSAVQKAEARMGVQLPPLLGRLLTEVANGGFGPGAGILGVTGGWTDEHGSTMEELFEQLGESHLEDPRWRWPMGLVPLVLSGGSFLCVDTRSELGRVVEWDPTSLDDETAPDRGWSRSFAEIASDLEGWLVAWLDAPHPQETLAHQLASAMSTIPEETRAWWAAMTVEQRAEYGLPETGWGRALFGDAWGDDPRDGSG